MGNYFLVDYQCKQNLFVSLLHVSLPAVDGNSPVGIVTHYRLGSLGIEYWWARYFSAPIHNDPQAHPTMYAVCIISLSWGRSSWGVVLTTHSQSSTKVKEELRYTSTLPLGLHGPLQGEFYLLTSSSNLLCKHITVLHSEKSYKHSTVLKPVNLDNPQTYHSSYHRVL
jgi:hypothetical protein